MMLFDQNKKVRKASRRRRKRVLGAAQVEYKWGIQRGKGSWFSEESWDFRHEDTKARRISDSTGKIFRISPQSLPAFGGGLAGRAQRVFGTPVEYDVKDIPQGTH